MNFIMSEGKMKKVLITTTHYSELCPEAKKMLLENGCELIENMTDTPMLPFEELKGLVGDIDAAIVGLDLWNEDILAYAKRLSVIAKFGVGTDTIDLNAAKAHGVKVINARGGNSNAVAELALGFMLSLLRSIPMSNADVKTGGWKRYIGAELCSKTVGLLGFGDIARRVAKKARGFDATVVAYDKYPNNEAAEELGVKLVGSMDELLAVSDIVSIHVPAIPENERLMNEAAFAKMKQGSYFINTARGMLVDEQALCNALESGHLAGAATDVYCTEPLLEGNPLREIDQLICTGHMGADTYDAYRNVSLITAKGVLNALNGIEPENWLNK